MSRSTEPPDPEKRSRWLVPFALLTLAAAVASCSFPAAERGADPEDTIPDQNLTVAMVERQDLVTVERLEAVLGYENPVPLTVGRDGVLTWMPDQGTVIRRGEVIAEIDGLPTRLLYGERPAWRLLAGGEPAGPDIRQLNDNIAEMGYADREDLPDDQFDWRTKEAVRDWQEDLGLKRTGAVEFGDVVFLPSEVRIGNPEAQPGTWVVAGQTLVYGTGVEQVVTVDLDPDNLADVHRGLVVKVVMPDRTQVEGVVRSIGRVVSEPEGEPVVTVVIELGEPTSAEAAPREASADAVRSFDAGPVAVLLERVLAEDVLVVPVGALLASAEGGYSVELVLTGGQTRVVAVEPGRFADGLVEITGDVTEGDELVVPS